MARGFDNRDEGLAPVPTRGTPTISDRIAAFAMLEAMTEATQAQKTLRLSLVGFSNAEIASMLQTTTAVVSQNLYAQRKAAANRAKGKAAVTGVSP